MSFIALSLYRSCDPSPGEVEGLSCSEKSALAVDSLAAVVAIAASCWLFFNMAHLHLVSYCLGGGAGAVALLDTTKLIHGACSSPDQANQAAPIQALAPISQNARMQDLLIPYHEEPLQTVGRPMNVKEGLSWFAERKDIQDQGEYLDSLFYIQRVRGGGNCFYLAYLSSLLHHLVDSQDFDSLIRKIEGCPFASRGQALMIRELQQLKSAPAYQNLYALLESEARMAPLISFLREFAIYYVQNQKEQLVRHTGGKIEYVVRPLDYLPIKGDEWRYVWNDENLFGVLDEGNRIGGIVEDKSLLEKGIGRLTRQNYCRYQGTTEIEAQRPEVGMLNDFLFPVRVYQRLDFVGMRPSEKKNNGLLDQYSKDSPLVLFSSPNHFDCLIPKQAHA